MRKYTFQMTKEEVRDFCLRAIWEQQRFRRSKWLFMLALLVLECILAPWVGLMAIILLLLIFVAFIMYNYSVMKGHLCEKTRVMWVEDGMLKLDTEGELYSEVSCGSITVVRMTRRLLMLGRFQAPKMIGWYPVPLRIFADEQERDSFLESIRNPQVQPGEESVVSFKGEPGESSAKDFGAQATGEPGQEYFHLAFQIGEEDWVRMMSEATEILQAGTLGEQKKGGLIWIVLAVILVLLPGWAVWRFPGAERITHIILFMGVLLYLMLLRNLLEHPEKKIRAQIRKGIAKNNACGNWETLVTETGIQQNMAGKSNTTMPWESLHCMVETDIGLFFYQKDKRHFTVIPKGCMESGEQIEALKGLCREKQVEILAGKRKKYVPGWIFSVLTVAVMAGYIGVSVWMAFGDSRGGTTWGDVPFDEQILVLRSLGFTIPEEMEAVLRNHIEENEVVAYVEKYPYTWLLMNLAQADDEEDWAAWFQDGPEVFWFDFEGWDISTDYIMVLEGMRELSSGSVLDDVWNIREDTGNMNWERGTGTITVSLEWNGREYSWKMDVEHDWIDADVLGIYNGLLKKEGIPERFYMTGDDGQGALIFYGTKEWASAFENATGLDLKEYMVKKGW